MHNKTRVVSCVQSCFEENGGCGSDGVCINAVQECNSGGYQCSSQVQCLQLNGNLIFVLHASSSVLNSEFSIASSVITHIMSLQTYPPAAQLGGSTIHVDQPVLQTVSLSCLCNKCFVLKYATVAASVPVDWLHTETDASIQKNATFS